MESIQLTSSIDKNSRFQKRCTRILCLIGCVVGIVGYAAEIAYVYGAYTFDYMLHPGAAYDYTNVIQEVYPTLDVISYPMWYRWIMRFRTLFGGLIYVAFCLGMIEFRHHSVFENILWGFLTILFLFHGWLTCTQSVFFIAFFALIACTLYWLDKDVQQPPACRKKIGSIIRRLVPLTCAGVLCVCAIYIFQSDRDVQREIQRRLYHIQQSQGKEITQERLENNVLQSINYRLDKEVFVIEDEEAICSPEQMDSITGDRISEISATDRLTMSGIDCYYVINTEDSWLYRTFPRLFYAEEALEIYVTQGYAALGLAFEHEFDWTYGIGNSWFLTNHADTYFQTNIFERTYIHKNDSVFGWSAATYWQSLYTWLAADVTFIGEFILFALVGFLFGQAWLEATKRKNKLAIPMLFLMISVFMMASANNLFFQELGAFIASWTILGLFVLSVIARKFYVSRMNTSH